MTNSSTAQQLSGALSAIICIKDPEMAGLHSKSTRLKDWKEILCKYRPKKWLGETEMILKYLQNILFHHTFDTYFISNLSYFYQVLLKSQVLSLTLSARQGHGVHTGRDQPTISSDTSPKRSILRRFLQKRFGFCSTSHICPGCMHWDQFLTISWLDE